MYKTIINYYCKALFCTVLGSGLFFQCDVFAQHIEEANPHPISEFYFNKPDSLFLKVRETYNYARQKEDLHLQARSLTQMGQVCFHLGHFVQALEYYLEAGALFDKLKMPVDQAGNYNDMGILHYYNRKPELARECYNKALVLYKKSQDKSGIAVTYGKIGHLFEKGQHYDSAFYYQRLALQEYQAANDDKGEAKIYENLGSIYEDLSVFDSAHIYFDLALQLYRKAGEQVDQIEVLNNIGDVYRKTGKYRLALESTSVAVAAASRINEHYQLSSGYRDIAKAYNFMGKNDSAFYFAELSRKYLLEIYSVEGSKQTAFLQVLYETEKKNNEIRQLQNAKKINRIISVSVAVIVLLLIVLGYLIINRQRLKIKNEQALNAQHKHILETRRKLTDADLKTKALEEDKLKAELLNQQLEKEKVDAELRNTRLEEVQLKQQIELKTKTLSTQALHVIQKNQLLEELKTHLEVMVKDDKRDQKKQLKQMILSINQNFNNDGYWEDFKITFEQVHQSFFESLTKICPDLTATELRLISLLKMNMNSADMSTMLGISQDSLRVSRYRLRKKLGIDQGENLIAFLQNLG